LKRIAFVWSHGLIAAGGMELSDFQAMVEEVVWHWGDDDDLHDDDYDPAVHSPFPNALGGTTKMQLDIECTDISLSPVELVNLVLFTLDALHAVKDSHGDRPTVALICSGRYAVKDDLHVCVSADDETRCIAFQQIGIAVAMKYHYHAHPDPWGAELPQLFGTSATPWTMPPRYAWAAPQHNAPTAPAGTPPVVAAAVAAWYPPAAQVSEPPTPATPMPNIVHPEPSTSDPGSSERPRKRARTAWNEEEDSP
jgi:hypothetical protein